jgi:antirestriction protein ArdC
MLSSALKNGLSSKAQIDLITKYYKVKNLYTYSIMNQILIIFQGGSFCQSFKQWKKLRRYVKKGEHARILVWFPYMQKDDHAADDDDEKYYLTGFGVGNVFDVSQTEGEPLHYEYNIPDTSALDYFKIKKLFPIDISEKILKAERGYYRPHDHKIVINEISNNDDKLRTLFHELGHSMLHPENCEISRSVKEVEAEAVCSLVCSYLELDYSLSDSYIAGFAKSSAILDDIRYTKIIATADSIIKKVNQAA